MDYFSNKSGPFITFLRCCHCYEVQRAIKIKLRLRYHLFYRERMT